MYTLPVSKAFLVPGMDHFDVGYFFLHRMLAFFWVGLTTVYIFLLGKKIFSECIAYSKYVYVVERQKLLLLMIWAGN